MFVSSCFCQALPLTASLTGLLDALARTFKVVHDKDKGSCPVVMASTTEILRHVEQTCKLND